jgi:enoyl-CoA hydratase/carnithine racemase
MSDHIRSRLEDGVLTLRLDRPEKKNALTGAMYRALLAGLRQAAADAAAPALAEPGQDGLPFPLDQ